MMIRAFAAVKGLVAFTTIVRAPNQLGKVFELRESFTEPKFLDPMIVDLKSTEHGREAFRLRRRLPPIDLDALAALPEGSLGQVYAAHMRAAGLDPAALPQLRAADDYDYVSAHLYETHDLWHALTGFDADVAGELGLQAFYLAQFNGPLPYAILAAGLLNTMFYAQDERAPRMDAIALGWQRGRAATPLFGIDWESLLPLPVAEVRARYGVVATHEPHAVTTRIPRPAPTRGSASRPGNRSRSRLDAHPGTP